MGGTLEHFILKCMDGDILIRMSSKLNLKFSSDRSQSIQITLYFYYKFKLCPNITSFINKLPEMQGIS